MTDRPPYLDQWPALLATARLLAVQRATSDAAKVESGDLTRAAASERARLARAHVDLWNAVVEREPFGDLGATVEEMRADLSGALDRAQRHADRTGSVHSSALSAGLRAMLWHLQPADGSAGIIAIHEVNLQLRARAAQHRKAA